MTSRRSPRVSAQAHQLNAKALSKALKKLAKTLGGSDNETSKAMEMLHIDATEELNLTSVEGIVQALKDKEMARWHLPFSVLGRGANAQVLKLDKNIHVYLGNRANGNSDNASCDNTSSERASSSSTNGQPRSVASKDLAIKFGSWSSQAAFEREVQMQRMAAESHLAPEVFFARWMGSMGGGSTSVNRGIMGMQCLSQPTFFTWLRWRSRAMREESGKKGDDAKWLIDPAIVRLPIYLKWRHEIVRIRKGIKAKKIIHGDLHQMNFVFHVAGFCQPGSREYFKVHNDPERKRRLMEAIEQGPAGPAKLYMVDFGRARKVNGIILRALHSIFLGEQRLPDPEMEPRSD
jgi:hypothetical protein|tara:strand:+ start:172 stop:1215 length:1044 start_codon:yes stop_codon:yes gene_type:complete